MTSDAVLLDPASGHKPACLVKWSDALPGWALPSADRLAAPNAGWRPPAQSFCSWIEPARWGRIAGPRRYVARSGGTPPRSSCRGLAVAVTRRKLHMMKGTANREQHIYVVSRQLVFGNNLSLSVYLFLSHLISFHFRSIRDFIANRYSAKPLHLRAFKLYLKELVHLKNGWLFINILRV